VTLNTSQSAEEFFTYVNVDGGVGRAYIGAGLYRVGVARDLPRGNVVSAVIGVQGEAGVGGDDDGQKVVSHRFRVPRRTLRSLHFQGTSSLI